MLEKCVLTILELNLNQRLGHKKTKLNICHHRLTSSTQLQNSSFDVVERTRTSSKCQKLKNARAKRAKILFFIVKYANLSGFCCRRRRGCLSSLMTERSLSSKRSSITHNQMSICQSFWFYFLMTKLLTYRERKFYFNLDCYGICTSIVTAESKFLISAKFPGGT